MYIQPKLRVEYQEGDYNNILKAFEEHLSVVYQAPTGSGKSVVTAKYIVDRLLSGKRLIFMANRSHLQSQMFDRLSDLGVKNMGIFNSSNVDALKKQMVFSTIQTAIANNNFELLIAEKFDDIVIDECHRSVTKSYLDVIRALTMVNNGIRLFGVTATTNRFDMTPLSMIYHTMVSCSKTMKDLVDAGYLAKHRVFTIPMEDLEDEIESYGGDYAMESMSSYMRNPRIIKKCVEQYETYAKGRSTIIYCVDKKHTIQMQSAYAQAGFTKSIIIDESVSENDRQLAFDKFKTGEIDIIFCIETLTEGLDLPNCNCIQLARPTKSMILYLQMVGRGLRPKEDGGNCIILDSALNVSRLGMPTSDIHWDLEGKRHKKSTKKGKVVVWKDETGKIFFEQNEDIPFAEMVEVGYGELAETGNAMIEMAEKANRQVYQDYYANFKELCISIVVGAGIDMSTVELKENERIDFSYDNNSLTEIRFDIKNTDYAILMSKSNYNDDLIMIDVKNPNYRSDYSRNMKDYIIYGKCMKMVGDMYWYINREMKNILNNLTNIRINNDDIQDIEELKKIQKEIEQNSLVNHIESELRKHDKVYFELDERYSMNEYSTMYSWNYFNCVIMITNQFKLLTNNKAYFYEKVFNSDTNKFDLKEVHYTKTLKQEKLFEILKTRKGGIMSNIDVIGEITNYTV